MESAPGRSGRSPPRPTASCASAAARSRPFVAGKLAEHVCVGVAVLPRRRDDRDRRRRALALPRRARVAGGRAGRAPTRRARAPPARRRPPAAPMVVAVGGPTARQVSAMAVPLARARGRGVHVLHVVETRRLGRRGRRRARDRGRGARAARRLRRRAARARGVPVTGELLHSYGTHVDVARADPSARRRPARRRHRARARHPSGPGQ